MQSQPGIGPQLLETVIPVQVNTSGLADGEARHGRYRIAAPALCFPPAEATAPKLFNHLQPLSCLFMMRNGVVSAKIKILRELVAGDVILPRFSLFWRLQIRHRHLTP